MRGSSKDHRQERNSAICKTGRSKTGHQKSKKKGQEMERERDEKRDR